MIFHITEDINLSIIEIDYRVLWWDGNGYIDYTEYLTATLKWKKVLSVEKLTIVFHAFDKDESGTISLEELKEFFGEGGNNIEEAVGLIWWKKGIPMEMGLLT